MLGRVKRGEPLESVFPRGILYDVYYTLSRIIYSFQDNPDARNAHYAVSTGDVGRKRGYGKRIQSHRRPAAAHSPIQGEPRRECAKERRMLHVKHAGARTRFRRLRSHPPRTRKKKRGGGRTTRLDKMASILYPLFSIIRVASFLPGVMQTWNAPHANSRQKSSENFRFCP